MATLKHNHYKSSQCLTWLMQISTRADDDDSEELKFKLAYQHYEIGFIYVNIFDCQICNAVSVLHRKGIDRRRVLHGDPQKLGFYDHVYVASSFLNVLLKCGEIIWSVN